MVNYQAIFFAAAAVAAILLVPHRVVNLGLRAVVKTLSAYEYLAGGDETVSPQYRGWSKLQLSLHQNSKQNWSDLVQGRWGAEHGMRAISPLDPNVHYEWFNASVPQSKAPPVPVLWLNTSHNASAPVILHFHGGGYIIGSAFSYAGCVAPFGVRTGSDVVSVDYRLAPENTFGSSIEDAVTAYRWLTEQQGKPADRIVVMGESAGGGIVLLLLRRLKELGLPLPAGGVAQSPAVDMTRKTFAPDHGKDPLLPGGIIEVVTRLSAQSGEQESMSPLFYDDNDFVGLPPLHIVSGGIEILLPGIEKMCTKLQRVGVNATCVAPAGMPHAFPLMHDWFPEADNAITQAAGFIRFALIRAKENVAKAE
eukprot:TRINITY_DN19438_c0_g1_i1.p1 TRINITY_DN19438_c0_g1~~TRINITY_DN19438_c0_g1_i1.p1  ORF type:complete len:365 (-),score=56.06 TRINITY_DN19438_c0_g1_i1:32-1126(-)